MYTQARVAMPLQHICCCSGSGHCRHHCFQRCYPRCAARMVAPATMSCVHGLGWSAVPALSVLAHICMIDALCISPFVN